jgi:hypothetical protein
MKASAAQVPQTLYLLLVLFVLLLRLLLLVGRARQLHSCWCSHSLCCHIPAVACVLR